MEIIKDNEQVLAKIIHEEDLQTTTFVSEDESPLQVGVFCKDAGIEIVDHIHNEFKRENFITQELIYLVKGKLEARIYTKERKLVARKVLAAPCMIYLVSGGHGFTILEEDTIFLKRKMDHILVLK